MARRCRGRGDSRSPAARIETNRIASTELGSRVANTRSGPTLADPPDKLLRTGRYRSHLIENDRCQTVLIHTDHAS